MGFDLYFVGAPPSTQLCNPAKHDTPCRTAKNDTPCRTAKNEEGVWRCETSGRARAGAGGSSQRSLRVCAYILGQRRRRRRWGKGKQGGEKKQNERKRRGRGRGRAEGEGRREETCFCIDEIWGYEDATRPRRELLCIRGVLTFPAAPTVIIIHTPHRMRAMSRRIGMEVKRREFPLLWGQR